jgi:hypothetical protein
LKITGAEWKEFEATGWPDGFIWADESTFDNGEDLYLENGELRFADSETFVIPSFWSVVPEEVFSPDGFSIRSLVKKWRKERAFVTLVVTVPRDQEPAARDVMTTNGWKVC